MRASFCRLSRPLSLLAVIVAVLLVVPLGSARASQYVLVPNDDGNTATNGRLNRYDAITGAFIDEFIFTPTGLPNGTAIGPDGNLYVATMNGTGGIFPNPGAGSVQKYDLNTGAFLGTFVQPGAGGLGAPGQMVFGPDGNLYVANNVGNVLRYNGLTGAFMDVVATGLIVPQDIVFGPDGNLYVSDGADIQPRVSRFYGTTGQSLGSFVAPFSGGLDGAEGLVFGPDGNLYVASAFTNNVLRYNGQTGAFIDVFATAPLTYVVPMDLLFGPRNDLYVDFRTTSVMVPGGAAGVVSAYDGRTGQYLDDLVAPGAVGGLGAPRGGILFYSAPSFRAPEPGTMALLALGLFAILINWLSKSRRQVPGGPLPR